MATQDVTGYKVMVDNASTEPNVEVNVFFERSGDNLIVTVQRVRPDGRRYHQAGKVSLDSFADICHRLDLLPSSTHS